MSLPDINKLVEPHGPPVYIDLDEWDAVLRMFLSPEFSHWIFRGQENYDWPLLSSLARATRNRTSGLAWDWENAAIGYFKSQASAHLARLPDEHDLLGWLSLMQHYRAPTRLLDWTQSPFVAAYFAFAKQKEGTDAVIWVLEPYYCARKHLGSLFPKPWDHLGTFGASGADAEGKPLPMRFPALEKTFADVQNARLRRAIRHAAKWPLPLSPTWMDSRMAAQQAVFTGCGDILTPVDHLVDPKDWGDKVYEKGMPITGTDQTILALYSAGQVIRKVRLRSEWRRQGLESLRRMGITAATLFPGMDGVGDATRQRLEEGVQSIGESIAGFGDY